MSRMHIAVRSGYVLDGGQLQEIIAGRSRVAAEVLERPGYSDYFDLGASVRGSDSSRTEFRATMPNGHMVAYDPRT